MLDDKKIAELEKIETDGLEFILSSAYDRSDFEFYLEKLAIELGEKTKGRTSPRMEQEEIAQMEIRNKKGYGIIYSTMPFESEWQPFVDTLKTMSNEMENPYTDSETMNLPEKDIKMEVYVTPHCPFCARAVYLTNCLAFLKENITNHVIDASEFPQKASNLGIRSTPALVIDNKVRKLGQMDKKDILDILLEDEINWEKSIRSLLEAGSIDEAASSVKQNSESIIALGKLLLVEDLSLRIGVLGVVEEIAEDEKLNTKELSRFLCTNITIKNPSIRGDIAYALGLLRHSDSLSVLENCLNEENPDVLESIKEAIEMIKEK